ncbi:MAG: hypothetical protein R3Y22_09360 [Bacteroidales bacterium]
MNRETLAAIDIGSNAIRLLIKYVEQCEETTTFKKAAFIRVPIRLGEDVFTVGAIGDAKREKMRSAMVAFSALMNTFNVKSYRACATSAMREAANGSEVVEYIRKESGINIEIISGIEEAKTIFEAGDMERFISVDQNYIYVDVGGGSTEVTVYSGNSRVTSESFPLGTVRMLSGSVDKEAIKEFKDWLERIALPFKPVAIIGSGGNINKVHKLLSKQQGESIKYAEIKQLYNQLKPLSYEERIEQFGLNTYRADVIIPAMKIFTTAAKTCKIDSIVAPRIGLADGIIHSLSELSSSSPFALPED